MLLLRMPMRSIFISDETIHPSSTGRRHRLYNPFKMASQAELLMEENQQLKAKIQELEKALAAKSQQHRVKIDTMSSEVVDSNPYR